MLQSEVGRDEPNGPCEVISDRPVLIWETRVDHGQSYFSEEGKGSQV